MKNFMLFVSALVMLIFIFTALLFTTFVAIASSVMQNVPFIVSVIFLVFAFQNGKYFMESIKRVIIVHDVLKTSKFIDMLSKVNSDGKRYTEIKNKMYKWSNSLNDFRKNNVIFTIEKTIGDLK